MSAIIKSREVEAIAARVRPLGAAPAPAARPPVEAPSPEVMALRQELEAARRLVEKSQQEIDRLKEDVRRAYRDGEASGHAAGLKEAGDREDERLKRLRVGLEQALGLLGKELASLERLAPLLAREALGKILADPTEPADLVAGIIRRQLKQLAERCVLGVEVSSQDFSAEAASAVLASIGRADLQLSVTDALKSGQCRVKLRLGEVEVGVGQQWSVLGELLQAQSEPGRPA